MTAQISAYGRLVVDVQSRTTSNGNTMSFTRMAVPLPCQKEENGEATFRLAVTAFGKQADALAKHQKGDLMSVSGNMQITQWTDGNGNAQTGYQVIADTEAVSVRTNTSLDNFYSQYVLGMLLHPVSLLTQKKREPLC
ncbi:single-stranded DNA-binding protein [Pectobacterium polaris]|uniref:single-stranded DNA-binding protein n=1 Tax=Pectobacterium polaris TaxID=2042057 RepID=UPI000F9A456B|nr:single-stranded DNA-binding protein [Pectobacterium polaris]RUS02758.1 Single-stranded DNA-binding protein [Pectobacterium polaris]